MIQNYLRIALRSLLKYKGYSIINILGLATGLTCFILIALYVQVEFSYDNYHEKGDRIYRVAVESTTKHSKSATADTPYPLAPVLKEGYPEFEKIGRLYAYTDDSEVLVEANGKQIYETLFYFAEPEILQIFSFPTIVGDTNEALTQPNSVVITASIAEKYFGRTDAIGQRIRFKNMLDLIVTAVIEDVPINSHFRFELLASFTTLNKDIVGADPNQWGMYFGNYTYGLVPPGTDVERLEAKIADVLSEHTKPSPSVSRRLFLQPLQGIHLQWNISGEIEPGVPPAVMYILISIGAVIILIACINFMNLATARSTRRAKEVGMRKVLGAARPQLIRQFLGESIWLSSVALLLSLGLVEVFLPAFSSLVGKSLTFKYSENLSLLAGLFGLAVLVGLIAGTYPATVLASFKPIDSLKGVRSPQGGSGGHLLLRKVLVVTQFAISVFLIASTLTINEQLDYLRSANLGFEEDLTIVIPMQDESVIEKYDLIKSDLLTHSEVRAVTASYKAPIGNDSFDTSLYPKGRTGEERISIQMNFVDYDFIEAFELQLIAGRNFSPEMKTDERNAFIINETTMRRLGIADAHEALGKKYLIGVNRIEGTIIGVVKDFHISSLHTSIRPLVMMYWPRLFGAYSVKISSAEIDRTLKALEQTWQKFVPAFPFRYEFLDEYIASLYQTEEKAQDIIGTFSMLAVFIACLGLLGLASFTAEQRTKEIGVRKVLGSSVAGIVNLLNQDFVKLVLYASLIAAPTVWFAMNKWLQVFAYRTHISWVTLAQSMAMVLLLALLTVSYQSLKAAVTNPVDSLKYE
jgi:putative ABC transport system permease protein